MSERMVVITDSWCGDKMACGTVTLKLIFGAFLVRGIKDHCMHLYELCFIIVSLHARHAVLAFTLYICTVRTLTVSLCEDHWKSSMILSLAWREGLLWSHAPISRPSCPSSS